ncbi:MAG: outer membrane beta-barrel protein [Bacteroidales bacterium]|nr:outer membrane beta-barrel protein [Bacteroidales bacterium]
MKKLIFALVALWTLLCSVDAGAQLVAEAGYLVNRDIEYRHNASTQRGIFLGAKYYYPLDDVLTNLSLVPGVNLAFSGGSHSSIYYGAHLSEVDLNIPVMAEYTYRLNDMIKLFAQAGPTIQFGLSHKAVYKSDGYKTTLNCYEDNLNADARKRLNFYLGLGVGVDVYDRYQLVIGYDHGLLQLSSNTDNMSITRAMYRFGLGYRF